MRELVVIVGPIASGKSTIACELGVRFRAAGRPVAVLDLDHVVDTIGGFSGLPPERFRQAQVVHGDLVGAWLHRGSDVIAHGPFFAPEEDRALLHAVPAGVVPRRVRLRAAYDRVESLLPTMPPSDWTFDTRARSPWDIADALAAALLSDA